MYNYIRIEVVIMKSSENLAKAQVERRLKTLRGAFKDAKVRSGWIRYMRQAMGMTLKNLAKAAGISIPTVAQAERKEKEGKVNIETLKKMASAMDCEFVYALVPKKSVQKIRKERALAKAKSILLRADVHMTLEDQVVKQKLSERVDRLAEKLLKKGDIW